MKNNRIKLYVVGPSVGYATFLHCELVKNMEDADLVLFTGGEDVDPSLYKEKSGEFTHSNMKRDMFELGQAYDAIRLKKPIFGTCRGAQFGCMMAGGRLVQHMNHPYQHQMTLYDGTTFTTNSLHHQMQHPYNLHPTKYILVGWAKGLSNIYLNGEDREMILPTNIKGDESYNKEAELVYYRDIKWLGIQGHPEMMNYNSKMCNILRSMVYLMLEDRLDIVLSLGIPTSRFVDVPLELHEDELQMYAEMLETRKKLETVN